MMSDQQRNRLHQLMAMHELNAKMGGTPLFSRITPLINRDLKDTLDEIEKEQADETRT